MTIPPQDKLAHFDVGVLIYAAVHFVSPVIGLAAVAIAAVGKEVYDYFHKGNVEVMDAVATILGGLTGAVCSLKL
jgi:hypothetical protein